MSMRRSEDGRAPFEHVPAGQTRTGVTCLYALGVTAGTTATTFPPYQAVTRGQIAPLAVRLHEAAQLQALANTP